KTAAIIPPKRLLSTRSHGGAVLRGRFLRNHRALGSYCGPEVPFGEVRGFCLRGGRYFSSRRFWTAPGTCPVLRCGKDVPRRAARTIMRKHCAESKKNTDSCGIPPTHAQTRRQFRHRKEHRPHIA